MAESTRSPWRVVRLAFAAAAVLSLLLTARDVASEPSPVDPTPPAVSITSPTAGAVVTGTVTTTADAADDTGVAGVQFQLDGAALGAEARVAPYAIAWNTRGSKDLLFGIVKVGVGPLTITGSNGSTRRLRVSCPGCAGDDMISVDRIQSVPGAGSADFAFSGTAHYVAHLAAFKAANTPVYLQGAVATSNSGSTSIAKAFGSTVRAGSLLVVAVAWTGNIPITVTDNRNNVYAVAATAYDATLGQSVAILYAANATAGSTTVTARFGTKSPKVRRLAIHEYGGMATSTPFDRTATNSANGTATSGATTGIAVTSVTAPVTNGSHMLTAVARDSAGNQSTSVPVAVTVTDGSDSTPPVISSVTVSSITASGATITWTTDEPGTSQVNYGPTTAYGNTSPLNSTLATSHTMSLSGLAGATLYHASVRSSDAAGNLGVSGDVTLTTLDGIAPTVSVTAPGGGATASGSIPVVAIATDDVGVVGVQFRLDGAAFGAEDTTAPYSVTWNTNTVANGVHTLTATARDAAGNQTMTGPVTVTVNNDTTPPVLSNLVTSAITASGATLSWTTDEASDSQVEFGQTAGYGSASALNSSLVTAHTMSLSGLADNTLYHVHVLSRDAAGNLAVSGDATFTTLDGTAPAVAMTAPASGTAISGTATLSATATDNVGVAGVQFAVDGVNLGAEVSAAPYSAPWNTGAAANGDHSLTATARDAAGNRTTSAAVTVSVNNDTTPPVLSNLVTSAITASGATVTWTTDEASDSQVEFGPTMAYGSTSTLDSVTALVAAHSVSLTGLTDATLYHVRVRSRDAAGNLAVSNDITLTTLDATAPAVAITAPTPGTATSGTFTLTATATDNVGVAGVQFRLDGATLGAEGTTSPYSVTWDTTTAANGSHTLTATAHDAAGNQATSGPVTVTVTNDTTPPVLSNLVTSAITASGVTVSWTTDEASDSQVEFGLTTAYGSTSALDTTFVAAHIVSLSGLTESTLYHVRVRSRDAAGNLAVSNDITVTTFDATAPAVAITAPTPGTTISGTVTLTATATDNVSVAGVQFAVDGVLFGAEVTAAPYSAPWNTAIAANGSHTLTATARDAAGNQTTSATVTVTVNNDTTPPVLSNLVTSAITVSGVTVSWTTDEASDSQVEFGLTAAYGSASALGTTLVTAHTVSLSGLTEGTLYHLRVRSRDAAGNLAVSDDITVTTLDATAPAVAITAPTPGTTVSGTATLSATATDNVGVAGVQFAVDGVNLGAEITAPPFSAPWITPGTTDLIFAVVKVTTGPMTISAGTGLTKRLGVSCPTCTGDDTVSVDKVQSTAGAAAATFTFSAPARYLSHAAAFRAATTPVYVQGAVASSNAAASSLAQTFATPIAAGNLIVASVAWTGTAPVTMTDSLGNSYAVAVTGYDATLNQSLSIFYAANARAGATSVTAGFDTLSPTVRRLEIFEYSGMATTGVLDGTATNSADGTTTADAITTGTAPTTVIGPAANGNHVLTAVARDAAGNTTTSAAVTVTVFNDAMPPVVSIAAPASGASVGGTVLVTANSTDDTGVVGVQFKLDGVALGAEDTTPPYSVSWNTATATNASHTLTAVARDAAGKQTTSAAVTVTVNNDTTPPVISGVVVSSILPAAATIGWATNEVSSSEVEYGLTTAYGSFSTLDINLLTAHTMVVGNLAPTSLYHFRVRSRDAAGNLGVSGDFTFTTLDGLAPVVSITGPAAGSTVSGTITVAASATDNVGVAGVQFQLDGAPLGAEDIALPYSIAWDTSTVTPGFHTLTAVARDVAGNRTTSAPAGVTIANSGQVTLAWDASIDPDLNGYKVYVGTSSGVYAVSTIDVGNLTTCTITGLQAGAVYYFAISGYNQSGDEGGFSNEVSSTIQ